MARKFIFSTLLCVAIFSLLLATSASVAKADTNVTVDIWSDESVNFYTNLNTTGPVNLNIDGTDLNQEMNGVKDSFSKYVTWDDMTHIFDDVANYFFGKAYTHPVAQNVFNSLNSVFINRVEGENIDAKLENLNYRVMMLEKAVEKINTTAYCQGKLEVMEQYNLSWVKCGENSTYYYNVDPANFGGNKIIGIEQVSSAPEALTADMKITSFSVSSLKAGKNATVDVTVKNVGNKEDSASVSLQLPEGWSMTPTKYGVMLKPGEEKTVEFTIVLPLGAKEKDKIAFTISFVLMNEQKQLTEDKEFSIAPADLPVQKQMIGYLDLFDFNMLASIFRQLLTI